MVAGVVALVVTFGAFAAAFRIDPEVVVQISTPPTGLWVPAPTTGEIVRVDVGSGQVTARVPVGEPGAELVLAERDNGVVVVDRESSRVVLVDPALQEIVREVRALDGETALIDIGLEAIALGSPTELAIVDPDVTGAFTTVVDGPLRSLASRGRGVVGENGRERFEIESGGVVADAATSSGVLVRVADAVVVVTDDRVEGLDGSRRGCAGSALVTADEIVGSAENWIIGIAGSTVLAANLDNGECSSVDLGADVGPLGRPVVARGRVFVPELAAGVVHIVEPWRRVVERFAVFSPGDMRLRSRDDFVIAYDTGTAVAALLDADGVVRFVDTGGSGIRAVLDEGGSLAVVGGDDADVDFAVEGLDGAAASDNSAVVTARVLTTDLRNPEENDDEEDAPGNRLVANFGFSADTVTVGEPVRFVDNSTGLPDSWLWDFGDGTGAEGPEVEKVWDEPGTFTVTLRIDRGDESAEISLTIVVVPAAVALPPAADFGLSASVVNVGDAVEFEDRSAGEIDRWRWDFGDGTTATAPNVSKVWGAPGTYTVVLTVANEQGSDSASVVIVVVEELRVPVAVIDVPTTRVDLGAPLSFVGSSSTDPARFTWDFGDGRTSTGAQVVHVFLEEGVFTVRLTAENDAGSSTAFVDIVVAPPTLSPIASIASLPTVIEAGQEVILSSLSTNAPDTELWSFGDGDSASGPQVTHVWTTPGTYVLTLTATNSAGTDSTVRFVEVVPELPAPLALVGGFDASPWVGEPTAFIDASIDASSWLWDFGDGVTSTVQNPLHTFTSAGQKIVTLTVSNRNGSDSVTVIVEPRLKPTAEFVVSSTAVRAGEDVVFTDASVNAVSWFWSFGDGAISGVQNPTHSYAVAGAYSVLLTVENANGDANTFGPVVINVDPGPPRLSGVRSLPDDSGLLTTLAVATFEGVVDPTSGPIDFYRVDFGDGTPILSGPSPRFDHAFAASGSYVVRMQARGPLGDWSEWAGRLFTVVNPPPPSVAIAATVPATAPVGTVALEGVVLPGSGPIDSWRWEITRPGGLWNYTGQTAIHNFDAIGVYTIKLFAHGPVEDAIVSRDITITAPPPPTIVSISAAPSPATVGVAVSFVPVVTGSVSTWEWDFEGGGYVPLGPSGVHIFNSAGPKNVSLRITGPFGGQDVMSVPLTVNPRPSPTPPVASPSGIITTGDTVGLSSTDANGLTGLTWSWAISNGISTFEYPAAGPSISHVFAAAGSWTVTVSATDSLGMVGTAVSFVTVQDPPPPLTAGFTWAPAGPQIQFTDTSTGPPVIAWSWDFGDPSAVGDASAQNPLVTYPAPGSYDVTLTVSSGVGPPDSTVRTITVP